MFELERKGNNMSKRERGGESERERVYVRSFIETTFIKLLKLKGTEI